MVSEKTLKDLKAMHGYVEWKMREMQACDERYMHLKGSIQWKGANFTWKVDAVIYDCGRKCSVQFVVLDEDNCQEFFYNDGTMPSYYRDCTAFIMYDVWKLAKPELVKAVETAKIKFDERANFTV